MTQRERLIIRLLLFIAKMVAKDQELKRDLQALTNPISAKDPISERWHVDPR